MCSSFSDIDIIRNIFKTHPMWNYKYYLIVEPISNDDEEPVGVGFKEIKIKNDLIKEFLDIDSEVVFDSILDNPKDIEVLCEIGLTHDQEFYKFIDEANNKQKTRNVLILKIEENEAEYEERLLTNNKVIKNVKFAWMLKGTCICSWKLHGYEAMSNEIIIDSINFNAKDIKIVKMSEELSEKKATIAVSKLF
ncbi:hypothetical protein JYG23_14420 [Sedimentibacter sp. zth1]|uniref:hypothetical protein n=1 Tax=Sedimentibacter sp. zth1 TaxID=2816908 RepID=UPI001A938B15|nr:hypothetical protein [Sedimentibacter sp. zth1]QSX05839.1 hypothetical protein JYG23_14420 [Sedimentibacter sp. zth1]